MSARDDLTTRLREWTPINAAQCTVLADAIMQYWLPGVLADAWDEGYHRGVRDNEGDIESADNPYRATRDERASP
jgi:hypothetical protein